MNKPTTFYAVRRIEFLHRGLNFSFIIHELQYKLFRWKMRPVNIPEEESHRKKIVFF